MDSISSMLDAVCLTAQIILESGGETYRAEESVVRMCQGLKLLHADVVALPTSLMLMIETEGAEHYTRIVRVHRHGTDLTRIDLANDISRKVSSGQMTAEDALTQLKRIQAQPMQRHIVLVAACALAAGSFTVMLGGGWLEFLISMLCGAMIQLSQLKLSMRGIPGMLYSLSAGALVSLIALLCTLIFPQLVVEPVISGAIMPVIPGLATTNAIRDTLRGDTISGSTRIMEALLSAITLAAGIGFTLAVWGGLRG